VRGEYTLPLRALPPYFLRSSPGRIRIECEIPRIGNSGCPARGRGDHRGVVGAEGEGRRGRAGEGAAQLGVRRDAADDRDPVAAGPLRRLLRPLDERAHDRALVRRGEVGAPRLELRLVEVAHGVEQRRLETGEGEVEAGDARDREVVRGRIAVPREAVDLPAAGIAEPEQP